MPIGLDERYQLEAAALEAWPALEMLDCRGWQLRFGKGYTKRANSANALAEARPLDVPAILEIKQAYGARGLSPVFRLVSDPAWATTDALLIERGYHFTDLSLVLTAPLDAAAHSEDLCLLEDPAEWLGLFQQISAKPVASQAAHLAC